MLKIKYVITTTIFALFGATVPAHAAPNYSDFYLPIVTSFKINVSIVAKKLDDGRFTYPLKADVEITVKVHANSLAGIKYNILKTEKISPTDPPCQYPSEAYGVRLGNTDYSGGEGNLPVLKTLVSTVKEGDWRIERYKLEMPIASNAYLAPCIGKYILSSLMLRDEAGHFKEMSFTYPGEPDGVYFGLGHANDKPTFSLMPESKCPKVKASEWGGMPNLCVESRDLFSAEFQITQQAIDLATAAASVKPSPSTTTSPKQGTTTTKMTTVKCTKKKTTLYVKAVKPKCPAGYATQK